MQIPVRAFIPALAAALAAVPLAANAQAPAQSPPPSYATTDESISGRIIAFNGAYDLRVRDDRGYVDDVKLHPGTVINPTGLSLAPGMRVTVHGHNAGSFFAADDIETPYTITAPVFVYPYYPYPYPYPAYRFGLGFRFR